VGSPAQLFTGFPNPWLRPSYGNFEAKSFSHTNKFIFFVFTDCYWNKIHEIQLLLKKKEILVSCTKSDNQKQIFMYLLLEQRTGTCVKKVTRFICLEYICVESVTKWLVDVSVGRGLPV